MKHPLRPAGILLSLLLATGAAWAQSPGQIIERVDIKFIGPATVSEAIIRDNIKLKPGGAYVPSATQDDVHTLYGTGQFYNIRISATPGDEGGVILTYNVQVRPRITDIKIEGNVEMKESKIRKKVTIKVGDALDEQKVFTDVQEMKKLYEKSGYPDTKVKYVLNIDEATGHGTVIYQIEETQKVEIRLVSFLGAQAFSQKELRKVCKTRAHWMFSWLTGSGTFKQDEFEGDAELLTAHYRSHGYLDFEIKDVKLEHPTTNTLVIKYFVEEGHQYRVGAVKFSGSKIFTDDEIYKGVEAIQRYQGVKARLGSHGLPMDSTNIFTPEGLTKDQTAVQDFYGSKGYIEISQGMALRCRTVPNIAQGTMDLEFVVGECPISHVQKIDIRGNIKTKDKVIRRELTISPGDVLDMVRVKMSRERLEGMQYFSKVDMRPEPTDPPIEGKKDLILNIEEQNTGNMTVGAGFSSVDALVGYAEVTQGNFDLFHPPYFTGGGQKLRLRVQMGTQRQDYVITFIEPWFLGRKLTLGVDLYRHELSFSSPNGIYDESRTGGKVSLSKALGSEFLVGSVSLTAEQVGISLNGGWHGWQTVANPVPTIESPNVPYAILDQVGNSFYERAGASLAYDTRNSTQLPNRGQRSQFDIEASQGPTDFYKLEGRSGWYFPGMLKGHVLEIGGRSGVVKSIQGGDVPFYDRYYLGGMYSLRGYRYRNVAPRQGYNPQTPDVSDEPIGGNTYWFGSAEYSIPIIEKEGGLSLRYAFFYDIGCVDAKSYSYSLNYLDDWGMGIRLNIPHLGPLRLDYGIPLKSDKYNNGSGEFQFGVGYTRDF